MVQARYSFLGWMRRGVATLADGQVDAHGRLKIPLELDVIAEGGAPRMETVRPNATVYGPGDISGIDPSAIVRVVPANGVRDFEANFLCAVEFYDEDFPWRYTPRAAAAQSLAPWLWVVALGDDEFSALAPSVIEVNPAALRTAFPDPATTAAWAHVQVDSAIEGSDVAAARVAMRQLLDANPNSGCSRIMCPRRLAPATHYTAFLVPAFERGRLAGLGSKAAEIEAVEPGQSSWPVATAVHGPLQFPVYHQWQFTTSTEGDFEDLARKLHAVPSTELADDVLLDIQEPGWNTHYRSTKPDRAQPGAISMRTAVSVPGVPSPLAFGGDPADAALAKELRTLLSAGDDDNDDPFVLPPRYGSTYRAAALGEPGATWYEAVNLDPAYRAIAGMGAAAVREQQESFIDRIWDRLRAALESRAATQRWQLSLHASIQLFAKRLAPALALDTSATTDTAELARRESRMFRAIAVAAPMHARVDVAGVPLATTVRAMPYASAFRGGFTKVTRASGPLMRRFATTTAPRVRRVFDFHVPPQVAQSALQAALAGAAQAASGSDFDLKMQRAGLGGGAAVAAAVTALRARLAPAPMQMVVATAAGELIAALQHQLAPRRTIPTRMREVLAIAQPATEEAAERIELPTFDLELPDPMYRTLAQRTELIVPGLGKLPVNGVTMVAPDATFIEAFMLGANHEIMRELIWREVPIPLDATIFRQFWDVRDNPAAIADPQRFRDILPIASWGTTELGAASHRPEAMRGALTVVVMRGDLLRKYPNAEVLVHPAAWVDLPGQPKKVRREAKDVASRPPLFSARIAPDVTLLGFQLDGNDAIGDPSPEARAPGWYFVIKERAGDVHFGLDLKPSANDPSWSALGDIAIGACIDARAASFRALPRYAANADGIAAMLYQRPFSMYVHASRLLHRS